MSWIRPESSNYGEGRTRGEALLALQLQWMHSAVPSSSCAAAAVDCLTDCRSPATKGKGVGRPREATS